MEPRKQGGEGVFGDRVAYDQEGGGEGGGHQGGTKKREEGVQRRGGTQPGGERKQDDGAAQEKVRERAATGPQTLKKQTKKMGALATEPERCGVEKGLRTGGGRTERGNGAAHEFEEEER